jgi:hypothetical protein
VVASSISSSEGSGPRSLSMRSMNAFKLGVVH